MLNDIFVGTTGVLLQMQAQAETVDDTNDVWSGWGSVIFVIAIVVVVAFVISIVLWQVFRTNQVKAAAQASIAQEEAYKKLAEQVANAQTRTADELAQIREHVTDLRTRVATIERLLAEVG